MRYEFFHRPPPPLLCYPTLALFEMSVEEVYTITGLGTVFAGMVVTGSIAVGDRIVCRTPSTELAVRVIGVKDGKGHTIKRGEPGAMVGVVCNTIDLSSFEAAPDSAGTMRVLGVRLVSAPEKKHWWQ